MAGEGGVLGQEELYRLALTYYKEQEVHLPLQLRVELVALSQQAKQGSLAGADLPPLGTFDIVGRERRAAWAALGDLGQEEAKARSISTSSTSTSTSTTASSSTSTSSSATTSSSGFSRLVFLFFFPDSIFLGLCDSLA